MDEVAQISRNPARTRGRDISHEAMSRQEMEQFAALTSAEELHSKQSGHIIRSEDGDCRQSMRTTRPARFRPTTFFSSLMTMTIFLTLFSLLQPAAAVFVNFDNCLPAGILNSNPRQLQFTPLFFDATFNLTDPSHHVNITVYGNVSGQLTVGNYPPPSSPTWTDPNSTFGKIIDLDPENDNTASTLFSKYSFLTYVPYDSPGSEFCKSVVNMPCPLPPAFNVSPSDYKHLPGFTVAHSFFSTYAFTTLDATVTVKSGDAQASLLACVSANLTTYLGKNLIGVIRYLPAAILAFVAIATLYASMYSPWGTVDPFRWSSNYGRDEDLLRLVTPGFGDCLGYIQFIVLTGALSLSYPGFYQPVTSQASWSILMFNESFVSHGNGTQSVVDGLYVTNGTYGMDRFRQLVGQSSVSDVWADGIIWLLVIIAIVFLLCQLGFLVRWGYRGVTHTTEQDLRAKNVPFTTGNIVRVVYNFFLLPIVALTAFQFAVAGTGPVSVVICAVIFFVLLLAGAAWMVRIMFMTRPRAHLFDDLPTVLLYGPLYNTYSDNAAPFACIPLGLTIVRGIVIGAVQPSGIAQLVLLAICEVVFLLTLHAVRPFYSPTSMNAYHTFFTIARLATILLSVAFVPSLGVSEATKGWIGYLNLLIHAIILVFGFFLNALQTIIEVTARLMGAGGRTDATRGGLTKVLGVRQLRRRHVRTDTRTSMTSDAAILAQDTDNKSQGERSRSMSASSQALLNRTHQRVSSGFDQASFGGSELYSGPGTPGGISAHTPFSYASGESGGRPQKPVIGVNTEHPQDPYFRRPRQRRPTIDALAAPDRSRQSWGSGDWTNRQFDEAGEPADMADREVSGGSGPYRGSESGAAFGAHRRDDSSPQVGPSSQRSDQDYAVREVDFYYGVRGPALSSQPARKLKTGPADPMNPVSSAAGWFSNLFKGKTKEKGKGFEVVRSTRVPAEMLPMDDVASPSEPYHDDPENQGDGTGDRRRPPGSLDITRSYAGHISPENAVSRSPKSENGSHDGDYFKKKDNRVSDIAPSLAPIEATDDIKLPSRFNSQRTATGEQEAAAGRPDAPDVPRKSSRRTHSTDQIILEHGDNERPVSGYLSPPGARPSSSRVPFGASNPAAAASIHEPFSGGSSGEVSREPSTEDVRSPSPAASPRRIFRGREASATEERPTSVGYVPSHRAGEAVHTVYSGAIEAQSAEVVGGELSPDRNSHNSQPGTAM